MIQQRNPDLNSDKALIPLYIYLTCKKLKTFVQRMEIFIQCVKTIIAFDFPLASFFCMCRCFALFLCFAGDKLLLPKSFLSADDETSNVLKRSVKICSLTFWLFALY